MSKDKKGTSYYFNFQPVLNYFLRVFKKHQGADEKPGINLRMMHGINRISILMFLFCLIVILIRNLF